MKIITTGLLSAGLLFGTAAVADHHGGNHNGDHDGMPTQEECEALRQARDNAMESGENMSDEDRRRLEICERGIEIEMNGDDEHDH